jgi:integrase
MPARHVPLAILSKSSGLTQLPFGEHIAPVTTFRINTYSMPTSVDSKELTGKLNPLSATLTKNRGEGCRLQRSVQPPLPNRRSPLHPARPQAPILTTAPLRKHLKPAAKKLGLSGVTWHLLRHSHGRMLDGVGTPIGTMQALLGHSAPEITREIYLHAIPEEQRRAVESVERLVFGPKLDPSLVSNADVSGTVH